MANSVYTNIYSLNTQRHLYKSSAGLEQAAQRISSGLRVNSARDDPSGLAAGMQLELSTRLIAVDIRNLADETSRTQIADGALSSVSDIVLRMGELNTQANNGSLSPQDLAAINTEFSALASSITQIQSQATMNGLSVFSGGVQPIPPITGTAGTASAELTSALDAIATSRAEAGARLNSIDFQTQALHAGYENQMAAKSRIMDADYAKETAEFARFNIIQQAGLAMLAQANNIPQGILTLLR